MNKLIAKPIVNEQYWIVTDGAKKIGNIHLNNHNIYEVSISGNSLNFSTKNDLINSIEIDFQPETFKTKIETPFPDYPTTKQCFNSVMDVQRGLHLFTKTKKSKCYHAAGYFVITTNNEQEITFCPKYIFIQRYDYLGPFKTKDEAKNSINS